MKISCIVVDDEPLARQRLEFLLGNIDLTTVVASCVNGKEALIAIEKHQPDLVFLDIQMPGLNGFDVLDRLSSLPVIIFVTAYDRYAIKAFEYHAIDYLLKPYKDARFSEALQNAVKQIQLHNLDSLQNKLIQLRDTPKESVEEGKSKYFDIKEQGRNITLSSSNIFYLSAAGNYVELHMQDKVYLYRSSISALEYELQAFGFIRIHRSVLVNKRPIERVNYLHSNNQYTFLLNNGESILSARSYKERIIQFMDEESEV